MEYLILTGILAVPLFFYNSSLKKKIKGFTDIFEENASLKRECRNQEYRSSNLRGEVSHLTKIIARRVTEEKVESLEKELAEITPVHSKLESQLNDLEAEYSRLRPKPVRRNTSSRSSSSSRRSSSSSSSSYYDSSSSSYSSSSSSSSSSSDWGGGGGSFSGGGSSDSW